MKRFGTLVMAILVITGCNAMQPNMEETELLWKATEKNIQKWTISTKAEAIPAEKPRIIPELTVEIPQKTPELAEEPAPRPLAATLSQEPATTEPENTIQPAQSAPQQTEPREASPVMIDWPYPAITCPPEPEPTPATNWPCITAPEPPTYTPEPEPTEPPYDEPVPTPIPVVPDIPVDPTPEPTEPTADPTPESLPEQPSTGYAECSCGARLTPEELIPHMKAHAINDENHSYRAY